MGFHDTDNPAPGERSLTGDVPGSIQPHGALLSLDGSGIVTRLAGDTRGAIGLAPEALLGRRLDALVDRKGQVLGGAVASQDGPLPGYLAHWCPQPPGEGVWDVTAHAWCDGTIVEFEPAATPPRRASDSMAELYRAIASLEPAEGPRALSRAAADAIRRLTGFDRVLVCRFLDDDTGTVVAESRGDVLPSLLHHHFRRDGIRQRTSRLYRCSRFRAIVDAHRVPAPLRSATRQPAAAALDMSGCFLRGASPAQLECLRSMGVASSLSIPVVVNDTPWGLIACHHSNPRHTPYEVREACLHLELVFSQRVRAQEEARHRLQAASLRHVRAAWLDVLRRRMESGGALDPDVAGFASLVPCDGAALVSPGRVERVGHTPGDAEIVALAGWLEERLRRGVFATDHLAGELPAAASYAAQASGLLAISVGVAEPGVLMWFRVGDMSRDQTLRHTARRWSRAEISTARQLRRSLTALMQQQALRDLANRLRDAQAEQQTLAAQKNLLMQEVHHRVQNSLQIVNSMLQLQARQTSDPGARGQFEGAVNRLMAVSAVHRHLWRSSDAQNVHLGPYFRELCADLMRSWGEGWTGHVTVAACDLAIPSQMAVTLALLVTELLTNAAKYAYAGAPGPVVVRVEPADPGQLQVAVEDRGQGMRGNVQGSGLGSKLIRIFTTQLGGSVETRTGPDGTTVTIIVPLVRSDHTQQTGPPGLPHADGASPPFCPPDRQRTMNKARREPH